MHHGAATPPKGAEGRALRAVFAAFSRGAPPKALNDHRFKAGGLGERLKAALSGGVIRARSENFAVAHPAMETGLKLFA
jgi:hypothetical protein